MSQSTCEESPAALPSKHTQNMTTVWWMIMPPLSDSHHHVLSRLLDCLGVLISSVLPKSALASLQSMLITAKWPFRKKKVRYSQNHFVTSHLIWNRWVESSPPAPHLPVFSHFIYSTPNKQCILPFRGPPACNVLLGQGWFCNASWTGVGLCPREQVTTSETFLTSCLRGRKYHQQTVSRGQGCCYRVESIESPHNKEPSIPKRQGEQSFRSPSPRH